MDGPLGDGYDVVVCDECGCGFADGIPSQEEMNRYYTEQSKYAYEHRNGLESPWDFKRFEATVEHLEPFLNSPDLRILDVGCATGGLLSVFRNAGFSNVFGVDPSPTCAEMAGRLHGIPVTAANLSDLGERPERFDLILMLGVLEHIREARTAVRIAKSLLRPGGYLYCAVPDVAGLVACHNAPYQQFSFEHVNFFSINSLVNLQGASGMAPVKTWMWTTEWREGVMEPIASGLFASTQTKRPVYDTATRPALEAYVGDSAANDIALIATINSLQRSQEPILVWGAGTLARRLLATTSLAQANITAFIDNNAALKGKSLAGKAILSPDHVRGIKDPILICSSPFKAEILATIGSMQLPNRIVSFVA
jgi:SAM-dependent methyltransferase